MEIKQKIIVFHNNVWSVQEAVSRMKSNGSVNYLYNGRVETAQQGAWQVVEKDWTEETTHNLVVESNVFSIADGSHSRKESSYEVFDEYVEDCGCDGCRRARIRMLMRRKTQR